VAAAVLAYVERTTTANVPMTTATHTARVRTQRFTR